MSRWFAAVLLAVVVASAACVPTIDESITIDADGSGEFTATWSVTRDDFDEAGFSQDVDGELADLEFDNVKELLRSAPPEALIERLTGETGYRPPPRSTLASLAEDDRVGIVYREEFSSLAQLASWRRGTGPAGALGGIADPGSGRLSLLALWGLQVEESGDEVTLRINPTRAFVDGRVLGPPDEGAATPARLRLAISVDGEVVKSNADRIEGGHHVWEPTIDSMATEQIASPERVRITWRWTPEDDETSRTTTIAVVLIAGGILIGLIAFGRYVWRKRLTRPLHYLDE